MRGLRLFGRSQLERYPRLACEPDGLNGLASLEIAIAPLVYEHAVDVMVGRQPRVAASQREVALEGQLSLLLLLNEAQRSGHWAVGCATYAKQ